MKIIMFIILMSCNNQNSDFNYTVGKLYSYREHGKKITCTFWKNSKNTIITAGHCCDEKYISIAEINNTTFNTTFILKTPEEKGSDLCILKSNVPGNILQMFNEDPTIGSTVLSIGYPNSIFLLSNGLWSGRHLSFGISSNVSHPGSSGSPIIFNDSVIGTVVKYSVGMDNISFISMHEKIEEIEKDAKTNTR